jgi:hypothetical protein
MRWIWLVVILLAAAFSGFFAFATWANAMMSPGQNVIVWLALAFVAIAIAMVAALVLTLKNDPAASGRVFPVLLVATVAAGAAPSIVLLVTGGLQRQSQSTEDRAFESKLLADLEARKRDVETRIAERRPYAGKEALDFVSFVAGTDLSYRSLGDHTAGALAVLKRALEGKVLDPNVMVRGPTRVDVADEPLFIQFSKSHIRSMTHGAKSPERVDRVDWKIQALLVQHGADLTRPEAAGVAEDVRRTVVTDDLDARKMRLR